ncbi:MAG TPA: SgcJ/EcaC family oxidoreductase [Pseudacidobacterium sp.]|jgi:uncharacterized protein (TIGR02246 family)|nr:SgcJ/EcaC family oxidoreductase [Pseudacidobacterium sp.]
MNHNPAQSRPSADEAEIRALIERWSSAVRNEDRDAIRKDHDDHILMFDVPPPFQSQGIEAYMATWEPFFSMAEKPVKFNFTDVEVTAGADVAFATAVGHCVYINKADQHERLKFRLTMGLHKTGGKWIVIHEHHSVPAE